MRVALSRTGSLFYDGFLSGVALALAYSLIVMVYVLGRTSIVILGSGPTDLIWISGLSVAWAIAVFSVIMSVLAGITGGFTLMILHQCIRRWNPSKSVRATVLISGIVGLVLTGLLFTLLQYLLGQNFLLLNTFLFWFGFPAILFWLFCLYAGLRLQHDLPPRESIPVSDY